MLQNESEKATEIKQNNVLGFRVMNLGGKKKDNSGTEIFSEESWLLS